MNLQKFTKKSIEAINAAQSKALENSNQAITQEHLLYALLAQEGGLIGSIFSKMGVDTEAVLSSLDDAISKITKVGGGGAELDKIYVCADCQRVLENAEKLAKSEGDEYVSVEHIAMAIFDLPTQAIRDIFRI